MSVNDSECTRGVREAAEYFNGWLKENWKVPYGQIEVKDENFKPMLDRALYAASVFNNEFFRKTSGLKMIENDKEFPVPDGQTFTHIANMCASYAMGNRKFSRHDMEDSGRACSSLVRCLELMDGNEFAQYIL
jgi:hypothetical protein